MSALVVFDTITGHTRRAAEDIAAALGAEGLTARVQAAGEMAGWDLADAAVVVVGSPCHAGSVALRSGLSGPIRSALKRLGASELAGKVGGAFSVHCAYGGHRVVRAISKRLAACGARVPLPGVVVRAGVPFSVVTGPMASEQDRQRLRDFARGLAVAAKTPTGAA